MHPSHTLDPDVYDLGFTAVSRLGLTTVRLRGEIWCETYIWRPLDQDAMRAHFDAPNPNNPR